MTDFSSNMAVSGNTVVLTLVDGDADGVVNGVIVDPGGLAYPSIIPQPRKSGGGGILAPISFLILSLWVICVRRCQKGPVTALW